MNKYKLMRKSKKELVRLLFSYQELININLAFTISNEKGVITYSNERFCKISGYSLEELIGKNHTILNADQHFKDFFKCLWNTIKVGKTWQGEMRNRRKNGTFFWQFITILPVKDQHGKIVQYLTLMYPINNKKKIEAEKQERTRLIDNMLFITSHKVRQPVCNILGLADQLKKRKNSRDDLAKIGRYMQHSASLLDGYLRDLTLYISEERGNC